MDQHTALTEESCWISVGVNSTVISILTMLLFYLCFLCLKISRQKSSFLSKKRTIYTFIIIMILLAMIVSIIDGFLEHTLFLDNSNFSRQDCQTYGPIEIVAIALLKGFVQLFFVSRLKFTLANSALSLAFFLFCCFLFLCFFLCFFFVL